MQTQYEVAESFLMIKVPRELDHHYAETMREEVELLIHIHRIRNVVFDFVDTEFMDSSGIGVLIGRSRNLSFSNGSVYAKNLNSRVKKIFQASGLDKIIYVIPEEINL